MWRSRRCPGRFGRRAPRREAWPTAPTAAARAAARNGFDSTQRFVDQPGRHDARLSNRTTGAYRNLGPYVTAVLSTITGCHLPASDTTTTALPARATAP